MQNKQFKRYAAVVLFAIVATACVIVAFIFSQLRAYPIRADTAGNVLASFAEESAGEAKEHYSISDYSEKESGQSGAAVLAAAEYAEEMFVYSPPEDLVYDGTAKQASVEAADEYSGYDVSVFYSSRPWGYIPVEPVDAGTYYVFASATDGEHSTEMVFVGDFTIEKRVITPVVYMDEEAVSSVVYNGEAHTVTLSADTGIDGESVTLGIRYRGETLEELELTDAGGFHLGVRLISVEGGSRGNYRLAGDVVHFSIERAVLPIPVIEGSFNDDGEEHTVIPEGFDSSLMSIQNNTYSSEGRYLVTVSINDIYNYVWEDGTVTDKRISFNVTLKMPVVRIPDMLDLTWLIVVLSVVIVAEAVGIVPLNKRRKRNAGQDNEGADNSVNGTSVMAIAPLALLAANLPSGQLGALIGLGVAAVGLAAADVVLGVKGNKKKAKQAAEEAAAAEVQPEPEPQPEPSYEPEPEPQPEPSYEPEPEPQPEPVCEPEPEPQPEPVYEPEPEPQPEPSYEPEPELVYDSGTESQSAEPAYDRGPDPELVYDSDAVRQPEPQPEPEDDREYATKVLYETKPDFVVAPAPVFVPVKEPEPEPEAKAAPEVLPVILPDSDGMYTVRYLYSFLAKLIQSSPEVQQRYCNIIDLVDSYEGVKAVMSWKHVRIYSGRKILSYMVFKGKKLCITFALDPAEFADTKYRGIDVSGVKRYAKTPMMLKLTSDRRGRYSEYLLSLLLDREGFEHGEVNHTQIYLPYETREQLIRRGLVKMVEPGSGRGEKERIDRDTFLKEMQAMRETAEEVMSLADESGMVITRYNYSFRAKLIQSLPEVQRRYGALVDFMRSYKKVKAAESWKQVRVYSGRTLYALFTYRGKKLCVSFALDPNEFAGTKYRGTDMSNVKKYSRTPLMLKLTSERRARYAEYLFTLLMERAGVPLGKQAVEPTQCEFEFVPREQLIQEKQIKMISVGVKGGAGEAEKVDVATAIRERIAMHRAEAAERAAGEKAEKEAAEKAAGEAAAAQDGDKAPGAAEAQQGVPEADPAKA